MMTSIYAIRVLCSIKSMQVTNSLNSKFTFCQTTPIYMLLRHSRFHLYMFF